MWNRPLSELKITMREANQAIAYLHINDPEASANRRTASLMAQIANWAGRAMKGTKMLKAEDFLPVRKPKKQTAQEMKEVFRALKPAKR